MSWHTLFYDLEHLSASLEPMQTTSHVLELACSPIPLVRIALVGLGKRGLRTLQRYAYIEGAEIRAIADLDNGNYQEALNLLAASGRPTPRAFWGKSSCQEVCRLTDIDLVIICTDWFSHTTLATLAMQHGKHVAVEVPAAMSISECQELVRTSETTRRHCFMLENCCFDPFALATLHMERQGLLGDIKHCEGAYFHDLYQKYLRDGQYDPVYTWMRDSYPYAGGNAYPTHGIGPISQLLNIHRGDRFAYLYSLSSSSEKELPTRFNTTVIKTEQERSILLQLDLHTPRPYSRLQTVCGTEGFVSKYPQATIQLRHMAEAQTDQAAWNMAEKHQHPIVKRWEAEAKRKGVDNLMNYIMDARLIYCLRNGLPLDIDVYDAAEWSCIAELTAISERENRPVPFPDFTNGRAHLLTEHRFYE